MRVSAVLLTLATAVTAQVPSYNSSLDMTIDPNTVDPALRSTWCRAQDNTCRTLCSASASTNDCDPNDLSYECLCSSNDSAPGLQFYTQTVPTFICQELLNDCIELNAGSQRGQEECRDKIESRCGKQDPPAPEDVEEEDDDEEEPEEDDEDAEETTAATTTQPPAETTTATEEEAAETTTDEDNFAAPTAAPKAMGALAAIGLVAALI